METRTVSVDLLDAGIRLIANTRERMSRSSTGLLEARQLSLLSLSAICETIEAIKAKKITDKPE